MSAANRTQLSGKAVSALNPGSIFPASKLVEKEDLVRSDSQAFHKHVTPSFRVNEWKLCDCD